MLLGEYQFISRFDTDALLPEYKGSTFRGVFGHALRNIACTLKQYDCDLCPLKTKCVYPLVFETGKAVAPVANSRIGSPPPPFVLEPPITSKAYFPSGSIFNIRLLVFGHVNEMLPYFILAVERMGKIGVGRRIDGKRGRFTLKRVKFRDQVIYSEKDNRIRMDQPAPNLELSDWNPHDDGVIQLGLTLETPLRFKSDNRLVNQLSFETLMRAMIRRVASLEAYYGTPLNDIDYVSMLKNAGSVKIAHCDIRWREWQRYSARQKRGMKMGGLIGTIAFEGQLQEFMPFVDYCSKVHLGKQTTFGLGKISCEHQRD